MQDLSRCVSCDYQTTEPLTKCPKCGRRLRTVKQARRIGWFQIMLGGFLVALMSVITIVVSTIISGAATPGEGPRFTGSPSDVMFIYGIFAIVIAIGLVSIAGGIMQIRSGKANKLILFLILALAIAFYIMAITFKGSKG